MSHHELDEHRYERLDEALEERRAGTVAEGKR